MAEGYYEVSVKNDDKEILNKKFYTTVNGRKVATWLDNCNAFDLFSRMLHEYLPGLEKNAEYYEEQGFHGDDVSITMILKYWQ